MEGSGQRGARPRRSIIDVYVVKMVRRIAEVGRCGKSNLSARSGNNGRGYGNSGTTKSMDGTQTPEHFLNAVRKNVRSEQCTTIGIRWNPEYRRYFTEKNTNSCNVPYGSLGIGYLQIRPSSGRVCDEHV
jgi:hypothetical protein